MGTLALTVCGMSWFDAVNHAMCALSTGGFSTRAGSIGHCPGCAFQARHELIGMAFAFEQTNIMRAAGGNDHHHHKPQPSLGDTGRSHLDPVLTASPCPWILPGTGKPPGYYPPQLTNIMRAAGGNDHHHHKPQPAAELHETAVKQKDFRYRRHVHGSGSMRHPPGTTGQAWER